MTSSRAFRRFAFAYGTAFAVLYVVALKLDLALFTVYPAQSVVLLGAHYSRDVVDPAMSFLAPAMYWYGWTASAALGALVFGLLGAVLPEQWTRRIWPGWLWVAPLAAMSRLRLPHNALVSALAKSRQRQLHETTCLLGDEGGFGVYGRIPVGTPSLQCISL